MVFYTQVITHKTVAKRTHEVTFKRPSGFTFYSGQYTQIAVPELIKPDPKGRSRQFSLASSPDDRENVRVAFRDTGSGFKETLMGMLLGSTVALEQAAGSFILPQKLTRPHVFVAGGIGITPFMSYLHQRAHESWEHSITLLYGNQDPESAAYLHELKRMTKDQPHFSLREMYERPTPESFAKLTKEYQDAVWWVVGPPAMVSSAVYGLQASGVSNQNILTESFEGY